MQKSKPIYKTNYWQAWIDFRKSEEYNRTCQNMKAAGIKQRYANNMLRVAFDAGWGNRKIVQIKITNGE